jgi:hypothetical protein
VTPRWQVYFAVDDCDAAARQAAALKGCVIAGPIAVPRIPTMMGGSRDAFPTPNRETPRTSPRPPRGSPVSSPRLSG